VNKALKTKEEDADIELTSTTLAGADGRPEVRVGAPSCDVGGASSVGAATAPALDEAAAPLFSPEEAKDFVSSGMRSK
jgi:hypothetical protein